MGDTIKLEDTTDFQTIGPMHGGLVCAILSSKSNDCDQDCTNRYGTSTL